MVKVAAFGRSPESEHGVERSPVGMADLMRISSFETRSGLARRVRTLIHALGRSAPEDDVTLPSALASALASAGPRELWLALAVLMGELPETALVLRTLRASRLDGPLPALFEALTCSGLLEVEHWPNVEVVTGCVVVDLHHTSQTEVTTGIQRVVRETVRRWDRDHDVLHVRWTRGYRGMRRLTSVEVQWALNGPPQSPTYGEKMPSEPLAVRNGGDDPLAGADTIVPWHCTVVVPELPAEPQQARRYQALAMYSGSTTGVIGYDCVPLTCPETSAEGMAEGFTMYLAAAAHFDRVAAISEAAATEYHGWRGMLAGSARSGPEIRAIPLAVEAMVPSEASMRAARELISIGRLPVVLGVGSHEPRKNHLAVLHAAEMLWREGLEFSLTFVGGHSWKNQVFNEQVKLLESVVRPVQTIRALSDELLWAAYHVAYCTVFVSTHEGFGLPVVESLASGTPVITSNFGSMQEIGSRGGSLLVNPADDDAIADALRSLLQESTAPRPARC